MSKLPRRVDRRPAPRAAAFEAELAPTESLFGRWSRYCLQNPLDGKELGTLFAPATPKALILVAGRIELDRRSAMSAKDVATSIYSSYGKAAALLGLPREAVGEVSSLRLCSSQSQSAAMSESLRACWSCMALGFHSNLFQHYALRCCPLHAEPLSTSCPNCKAKSTPTFSAVSRQPFSCRECGHLWLRTAKPAYGNRYLQMVGTMLSERRRDVFQLVAPSEDVLVDQADARSILKTPRDPESAGHGRHVARCTTWPAVPMPRWPSFDEQRQVLFDWSGEPGGAWPAGGPLSSREATRGLHWLIQVCANAGHLDDARKLNSKLSMSPRGLRINDSASVVAVALHLTLCTYGKHASEAMAQLCGPRSDHYGSVVWNGLQVGRRLISSDLGNAQVLVAEIMGWFAASIVEVATMQELRRIDWGGELPKTLFLPAWIATQSGSLHVLRVRPRADERTIMRLLKRYPSTSKLRERPQDPRIERRVGQTWNRMEEGAPSRLHASRKGAGLL